MGLVGLFVIVYLCKISKKKTTTKTSEDKQYEMVNLARADAPAVSVVLTEPNNEYSLIRKKYLKVIFNIF